jgi:hypothetical protein
MAWLSALPETTATMHAVQYEQLQLEYTMQPVETIDPRASRAIIKLIVQCSKEMVAAVQDEVKEACHAQIAGHDDWHSVRIHELVTRILAATANRFLVGTELCEYCLLGSSLVNSGLLTLL